MLAGSASGKLLPPFVVYKSNKMWSTWCEGGPNGARYTNTSSGWFDGLAFEDWYCSLMLPCLKVCRFVYLPPNSSHFTQPLDVAFFHPMKVAWRKIFRAYKETPNGTSHRVLHKQYFPALLKELMQAIEPHPEANLQVGFKKCGIWPTSVNEFLESLNGRSSNESLESVVEDSCKDILENKRNDIRGEKTLTKGSKKKNVPAGKSIALTDFASAYLLIISEPI